MTTRTPRGNTPGLRLVGEAESGSAFTTFGPVRAGLTTTQPTSKEVQLSELLNSLEKRVEILESRYSEVLDTFLSVTEHLVRLGAFTKGTTITD